ncbi:hypothetical protein AB1L16_18040 [Peribacillus frigoritolerans]|uniref:hypothetical protein n=1 Tax=Peribacillus frigoritolerans TaxID=450367 RepID=UPI0039A16547
MSRMTNFIKMNQKIFQNLYGIMEEYPRKIKLDPRWIHLNVEEKKICNNLYIRDTFRLANGMISCLIEDEHDKYFAIIGLDSIIKVALNSEEFMPQPLTKEFFFRLVCDLDIKPRSSINPYSLENDLLFYSKETPGYIGHEYDIIKSYFPPIYLYKLDKGYILYESPLINLTGYFLSDNSHLLHLNFSEEILENYQAIFKLKLDSINYASLAKSLINLYFKDTFLDVYRCIEYIYKVYSINEIKKKIETKLDIENIFELMKTELNYKFTEESSIQKIFENLSEDIKSNIRSLDGGIKSNNEYKWFYNVRNSLVHGRRADKEIQLHEWQWLILISASLDILKMVHNYLEEHDISVSFINKVQTN